LGLFIASQGQLMPLLMLVWVVSGLLQLLLLLLLLLLPSILIWRSSTSQCQM
jgi:hypothetical protein